MVGAGSPDAADPGRPVLVDEVILVLVGAHPLRVVSRDGAQLAQPCRDRLQLDRPLERDRAEDGPAHVRVGDDDAVVAEDHGAPVAERLGDGPSLLLVRDQLGGLLEVRDAVREQHCVVCGQPDRRSWRRRRSRRGMCVDDGADVWPRGIDLRVDHGLQVQRGRGSSTSTTSSGLTSSSASPCA